VENNLVTSHAFPKTKRLRKSKEFIFSRFRKHQSENFLFVYSQEGSGKLGISIAKKVLRESVARNRVKRLIREAFRYQQETLSKVDLHVIGKAKLSQHWKSLKRCDVENEFTQSRVQIRL
jgi:ribonuclease P protein component